MRTLLAFLLLASSAHAITISYNEAQTSLVDVKSSPTTWIGNHLPSVFSFDGDPDSPALTINNWTIWDDAHNAVLFQTGPHTITDFVQTPTAFEPQWRGTFAADNGQTFRVLWRRQEPFTGYYKLSILPTAPFVEIDAVALTFEPLRRPARMSQQFAIFGEVPEPATWGLLAIALAVGGAMRRRAWRRSAW